MSFQFSYQFHRHWLNAPENERRRIKDDLESIIELLDPDIRLVEWKQYHNYININKVTTLEQPIVLAELDHSKVNFVHTTVSNQSVFLNRVITADEEASQTNTSNKKAMPAFENVDFSKTVEPTAEEIKTMQAQNFMENFETRIDNCLAQHTQKVKSELMMWAAEYIASQES